MQEIIDISSKEFQDTMKIYFESIIKILECHEKFKEYNFKIDVAVHIIQKSLKTE